MIPWDWIERKIETNNDVLPEKGDVIIGLGMDVSKNGKKTSPQSEAVALEALALFQRGRAENILFTGGHLYRNGLPEAELMARLVADKVSPGKLFRERQSRRTYQNADFSLLIARENGWKNIIVVCQQWQARRARKIFAKRWKNEDIRLCIVKARSPYGGGSMKRLSHPLLFWIWDTAVFVYCYLKGYC